MSSIPVQFLIYVMPEPTCQYQPIIQPLTGCLEVAVNVTKTFNLTIINQCDPSTVDIADLIFSKEIDGMTKTNLTTSSNNASVSYVQFTWTPQPDQIGEQQLCTIAYTV